MACHSYIFFECQIIIIIAIDTDFGNPYEDKGMYSAFLPRSRIPQKLLKNSFALQGCDRFNQIGLICYKKVTTLVRKESGKLFNKFCVVVIVLFSLCGTVDNYKP